ncbi:MAG TPA: hypothetical protein VF017_16735 [Thermoanaerobaculia bacterium]|nr:hypothetical protein [Thermoanaerobaculia bacterium]
MLDQISKAAFDPLRGQTFRLSYGADQSLDLELAETTSLGAASKSSPHRAPFTLVFRHNGERRNLPQGTYALEHTDLGRLEIFLVPIGPDSQGMRYEAVFT